MVLSFKAAVLWDVTPFPVVQKKNEHFGDTCFLHMWYRRLHQGAWGDIPEDSNVDAFLHEYLGFHEFLLLFSIVLCMRNLCMQ